MASRSDADVLGQGQDRAARRSPPVGWSASKSQSLFQDGRQGTKNFREMPDHAGPQGGGGSTGPTLPFRIVEGFYVPKATGSKAIFTITRPRQEELQKADSVIFMY
mmetsp:Transcript_70770/g.200494  ORF Transcript_70770/g.200494 Transcript_70770/m.200494 type:complete len:106 (-) Transcript_70770:36-353(-)